MLGAASSHLFTPRCFCRRDKRPSPETAAEPRQGNPSPGRGGSLEPASAPAAPHGQRDQPELGHRPATRCPGPRGARPGRHVLLRLQVAPPAPPAGLQPAARERRPAGPEARGGWRRAERAGGSRLDAPAPLVLLTRQRGARGLEKWAGGEHPIGSALDAGGGWQLPRPLLPEHSFIQAAVGGSRALGGGPPSSSLTDPSVGLTWYWTPFLPGLVGLWGMAPVGWGAGPPRPRACAGRLSLRSPPGPRPAPAFYTTFVGGLLA